MQCNMLTVNMLTLVKMHSDRYKIVERFASQSLVKITKDSDRFVPVVSRGSGVGEDLREEARNRWRLNLWRVLTRSSCGGVAGVVLALGYQFFGVRLT